MANRGVIQWLATGLVVAYCASALASPEAPALNDPALEVQVMRIASDLRCLVCQNQTVADSQADLAIDLRKQVRDLLQRGKNEAEITNYLTARYGDFVLYRPALRPSTWLLWFGPAALTLGGLGGLVWRLRKRNQMPAGCFDPEPDDAEN